MLANCSDLIFSDSSLTAWFFLSVLFGGTFSSFSAASSETSICKKGKPEFTVSPTETSIEITLPIAEAGISIAALSDSKTMIGSSESTWSPTLAQISITSTSSASPRSGILIVLLAIRLPKDLVCLD